MISLDLERLTDEEQNVLRASCDALESPQQYHPQEVHTASMTLVVFAREFLKAYRPQAH